jgi:hypothetical protein
MRKILFCWELGEDYGHLGKILALANQFNNQGIDFYVASKDLSTASKIDWPAHVKFIQAPIWLQSNKLALSAASFAEILLYKGFDSYRSLKILTDAWLSIFNLVLPDIILFDHSPSALLAASNLKVPKLIISNPYLTPAPGTSAINLIPNADFDQQKALEIHAWVLNLINSVKKDYGTEPIQAIGDLFKVDETFLSGFSETDYFSSYRSNVTYCGAALAKSFGRQDPHWQPGFSRKSIAYLKARDPRSGTILQVLAAMQARTLCFYSGSKTEDIRQFANSSLTVSNVPFNLTNAYAEAGTVICHGGQGVVNEALSRGIPLIMAPTQAEQYFIAERIKRMGAGIIIDKNDTPFEIENKISNFFSNPIFYEKSQFLAKTQLKIDSHLILEEITRKIRLFAL